MSSLSNTTTSPSLESFAHVRALFGAAGLDTPLYIAFKFMPRRVPERVSGWSGRSLLYP